MMRVFDTFFKIGTGKEKPFSYQCRLACGERGEKESDCQWLSRATKCETTLITIPTGLGKTEAVVFAWLWNRFLSVDGKSNEKWQTRLVYCLPMRTLVEQTANRIKEFLKNLFENAARLDLGENALRELEWMAKVSPVVLMGGEELNEAQRQWDIFPEKPSIIIGTQDMLLSRALNRGYGMNIYRWPMHFGLLNVDSLWVFDETQLMGVSMETSAQLDAFRKRFGNETINCKCWWMSATLDESRLDTIDQKQYGGQRRVVKLSEADLAEHIVSKRVNASKPVSKCPITLIPKDKSYAPKLTKFILEKHKSDSLTIVIVNRVDRAQEIFTALEKEANGINLSLIHSRFRPADRKNSESALKGNGIVVSTQAIEAGVDCSAKTLITELAPWSSLIQRFGRCNRKGEDSGAEIYWIDYANEEENDEFYLPYKKEELKAARANLQKLGNACISELQKIPYREPEEVRFIIRSKDVIELFDTTPDISGRYIDVTRFIREKEGAEVQVFWRENVAELVKSEENIEPISEELCRVPLSKFKDFITKTKGKQVEAYYWNYLDERWDRATEETVYPGGIYILDSKAGGYSEKLGWTGVYGTIVKPIVVSKTDGDSFSRDRNCKSGGWVLLSDHLIETHRVAKEILLEIERTLPGLLEKVDIQAIENAALYHDLGKAHPVFQNAIRKAETAPDDSALYAKSPEGVAKYERKYFRHELASAIAWLMINNNSDKVVNLAAYLIAAHHGKVRLSIRSMPDEKPPQGDLRIARGIYEGDVLPPVSINGNQIPEVKLDLSYMEIGFDKNRGESWIARMTRLRDEIGIFKLGYLETLVRAADARASIKSNNSK